MTLAPAEAALAQTGKELFRVAEFAARVHREIRSLDEFKGPEVVQVDYAEDRNGFVDHDD